MQHVLGVDIGNSGLRVARLDLLHGRLGDMLRIDWCLANNPLVRPSRAVEGEPDHSSSLHRGPLHAPPPARRYRPDDPAWLEELEPWVAQLATERANASESQPSTVRWLVSSVRRDALQLLESYLRQRWHHAVEVVTWDSLPLQVDVEFPRQVGIDRLLAALAALQLTAARPLVVIQAGSAVTVDLVSSPKGNATCSFSPPAQPAEANDAATEPQPTSAGKTASSPADPLEGCFEGGAIVPGVPMMLRLLGQGADLLPQLDADDLLGLPSLPGKNTEQAMRCGAASALVGGVMHLVARYRQEHGSQLLIILSGGDGMRLGPYLPEPLLVENHLVHRGLLKLAQLSAESN